MSSLPAPFARRDDTDANTAHFAEHGWCRIEGLFETRAAKALQATLKALPWQLVLNDRGRHFDVSREQQAALGAQKLAILKNGAQQRARSQFQYLYENFPVFDLLKEGRDVPDEIFSAYEALNSDAFRTYLESITGLDPSFCDIQATRFRAGHFLNVHDDNVEGKGRLFAYVFGLSSRWANGWGGELEMLDATGATKEKLRPSFNALTIFRIPVPHQVCEVTKKAESGRISLTGWYRQGESA